MSVKIFKYMSIFICFKFFKSNLNLIRIDVFIHVLITILKLIFARLIGPFKSLFLLTMYYFSHNNAKLRKCTIKELIIIYVTYSYIDI